MSNIVALDVGTKRIGVAVADDSIGIAVPYDTIAVDGNEVNEIRELLASQHATTLVVGYPRNQSGEPTAQTAQVESFVSQFYHDIKIEFQDESLTSVLAEQRLNSQSRSYSKAEIDSEAATIILQDYLEQHRGS